MTNYKTRAIGPSDEQLLAQYTAGDQRAFTALFNRHYGKLVAYLGNRISDRDAAQDLAQRAFVRVFQHAHTFEPRKSSGAFSSWLFNIATKLSINALRDRDRVPYVLYQQLRERRMYDDRPIEFADTRSRTDELCDIDDLADSLQKAMGELSPKHQTVIRLRHQEEKTYEEISEITGENIGTVKSQLNRARACLKKNLEAYVA